MSSQINESSGTAPESGTRTSLGDEYKKYFRIGPALDEERKNDVYHIRHEVYARDLGFEPVREHDPREMDQYDRHSLHCLVTRAESSDILVGCTRLILTDPLNPSAPLPFEKHCHATLDRSVMDTAKLPRNKIAEVSRLAVMSTFRRRKGEQSQEAPISEVDYGSDVQPRFPYIPISLYFGSIMLAQRRGLEYIFILTEQRLMEHLGKMGLDTTQIGPAVELRGQRIPSAYHVPKAYDRLRKIVRPLWHEIERQMGDAFKEPAWKATEPAPFA